MNLSPIPIWDRTNAELHDGLLLKAPSICSKYDVGKCAKFYDSIHGRRGLYMCPCGLSAYCTGGDGGSIFSGIRIAGHYDNRKIKRYKSDYLPTLPVAIVVEAVAKYMGDGINEKVDIELVNSSLHEIRKLNTEIKRLSEEVSFNIEGWNKYEINKRVKSIFASSSLISVRLNVYDFGENPHIITASGKHVSSLYKKFDKAKYILEGRAKDKEIDIRFVGNSYAEFDAYPILDILPFVLLENAVKYSPPQRSVRVIFEESDVTLSVSIKSVGPKMTESELGVALEKGGRGHIARAIDSSGGGYGLYFASMVCGIHEIDITLKSGGCEFDFEEACYADFEVQLRRSI